MPESSIQADVGAPGPAGPRVAVVIPCFRVTRHILGVLEGIGDWAHAVYCVDDACPEGSGDVIEGGCRDPRVRVVRRPQNGGVGAATMTGYQAAIADGCDVLVKIDGDGQMDPRMIPGLIRPLLSGEADYVKANRFFSTDTVSAMPWTRLVGNAGLSFLTKLSTGYWQLFDPTNGFTAIDAGVAAELPMDRIHPRYFFESDMLFRLGVLRARVVELPQHALYAEEESGLSEVHALLTFPGLHLRNFLKRIGYNYFLRGFSLASVNLLAGLGLLSFGLGFGAWSWAAAASQGEAATSGTVMLAALPILMGFQLLLSFLAHDVQSSPRVALQTRLADVRTLQASDDG